MTRHAKASRHWHASSRVGVQPRCSQARTPLGKPGATTHLEVGERAPGHRADAVHPELLSRGECALDRRAGAILTIRLISARSPRPCDAHRAHQWSRAHRSRARHRIARCCSTAESIVAIASADDPRVAAAATRDLQGNLLLPGFIDTQVNGGGGVLFNDDPSVEAIRAIGAAHRALRYDWVSADTHQRRPRSCRASRRGRAGSHRRRACRACSAFTSKARF